MKLDDDGDDNISRTLLEKVYGNVRWDTIIQPWK
jgi:hypothetical protein